ncbi:hypothetical protein [Umezakia ovalisporum]|uniref:Beta/gamma crystallin family protein n=1 Tax=Umezakia ovalisporum FSS-62 TaxID=2971776 RepID=A0AA43KFB8_9CYAN|nr:hypothetical protein [Umezakia ovalisporum]MDH6064664.1 beta/gamma crystallin family protein [Umezakia ovalisporum FSS-62]
MTLSSINSNSQAGSLELLATELTSPPALLNNSGSTVTITLTATGQWSLINFETSDPSLIKYKTPVDGDGHPRDKNDEKYKLKYPQSNPGALVGEIKDAKGNTKSTVSGKQQSFELQPGETVSFLINDDPKWYGNNAGKLTISYTSTVKSVEPTKPTDPKPQPEIISITDLYNTGVDNARQVLSDSIRDPHYTLATYPAGTELPGVTTPNKDLAPINWVPNTQTARWIGPKTPFANGPVGNYSYTTTFTLPEFSEALIVGELSVDDNITDIVLNGVSVGNPVPLSSWTKIGRFSISTGFVVGTNTLEFKLHSIGGPTGLRIDSISGTYKPSSLKATIYEDRDFQGVSKEVGVGSHDVWNIGFPNDALSSLKVPQGLKVTLYQHATNQGRSKVFTADAPWVGDDFDNITSAIKVELLPSSLTAPIVVTVPPANAPTIPQGFHSPFTFTPSAAPVIQWNGYTYWAYSYADNRMAMAILAYDAKGQIVKQWEKPGARYLTSITVDSAQKTIILTGQANQTTVLSWDELRL